MGNRNHVPASKERLLKEMGIDRARFFHLAEQAQIITRAVGGRGPNPEYLWNTAEHLNTLGVQDPDLDWLSMRVRALAKTH